MQIEPEWGTMTLPEPEPSPLAATPGTEAEFQYPSNSENPSNQQHDSEIPRSNSITTTTTITAEDEDLYRDLENLENVSDLIRQNSEGSDDDNPFYSGKKLLPLITGNDDDTEIDGPDQLPVLDDPLSATLHVGSTENLEETVPLTRRDRSRSEAGERDAELAGLAFAKHLALQIVSDNSSNYITTTTHQNYHGSGLVREDSLENGLTLVPATPPPTPLSRTSSSSSNISILNPTLSLHTVSEEGHGTEEELGNGEDGEEGGEEGGEESTNGSGVRSLVSGGSLVINPPTTPMAASTRSNIPFHQLQHQQQQHQQQPQISISILPPSSSAYIVPMTPPTTPQNRTSGPTTSSSTITYQKQSAGFYKPVKPELKQRSGKGASLLSSSSNQGGSGMPPPTPPVTPMNRTGFGHGGRPPPIVANHIGDPAPTPPPTPMSGATNTPIASSLSIRVSTETAPDYIIPEMSPVVGASRSRSASDITGNSSGGGLSEIKGHLSNSLLASKFATLSIQTPTSGTGGDDVITPRSGNAVIVACRVFDCTGRAFLRGYCAKHWRLAKRTPQEMLDSQDADNEQDGDEGEDSKSDLKVDSEPSTPASYEYTLPWLVNSEDGESHWQDWKENLIPASSSGGSGSVVYGSQEFNVTNVTIQEYLPQAKTNFECSPVSQLITILVGTFSIRASDGKSKTVTPGNMVLLQDSTGKGHQITVIGSGKHLLSRSLLKATIPTSTATTQ